MVKFGVWQGWIKTLQGRRHPMTQGHTMVALTAMCPITPIWMAGKPPSQRWRGSIREARVDGPGLLNSPSVMEHPLVRWWWWDHKEDWVMGLTAHCYGEIHTLRVAVPGRYPYVSYMGHIFSHFWELETLFFKQKLRFWCNHMIPEPGALSMDLWCSVPWFIPVHGGKKCILHKSPLSAGWLCA